VNELLVQIADINEKIVAIEVKGTASDLRDQRTMLVRELGEYMDINSYEHEEGSLTVTTARGYILVSRAEHYSLTFDGHDIRWEGSGNNMVAITDTILGGKMGGWLDMRDEIIPKHQADLSELAKTLAWEVNEIHSLGVGTSGFGTLTSTYTAADSTEEMGTIDSGLDFYDRITDGAFTLWLYDDNGAVVGSTSVAIAATGTTLDGLAATLDGLIIGGENALAATVVNGKLQIQVDGTTGYGGYSFAFSDDTSHVLAALGINTFFSGSDANTIGVNDIFSTDQRLIAAGKVDASGAMAAGDNTNALDLADLQYEGVTIRKWTYERGSSPTYLDMPNTTLENYLHDFVGSIGIQSQSAAREREYNEVIIDQLKMTRENISGVSIDEEMTNLIKFQQAYAAAAKLVTTADEMLKVILETK
jgi:flagellar hook-associated protein 1 FlgK